MRPQGHSGDRARQNPRKILFLTKKTSVGSELSLHFHRNEELHFSDETLTLGWFHRHPLKTGR